MHRPVTRHVFATMLLSALFCAGVPAVAAEPPEPGTVVTLADVEKVLGGKFTSRSPEPGALYYEEEGGSRQVNVYLWPADGKTVAGVKETATGHGETIDDIADVGDAAMYRPQGNDATVEKRDKDGDVLWLSVVVHNVANAEDTKRFAIELAKRGAARL